VIAFFSAFVILDLIAGTSLWMWSMQPDAPYWLAEGFWHYAVSVCPLLLGLLVVALALRRTLFRK